MSKKLELNISERLASLSILNGYKGNLDTLSVILEDIRKFVITDEEWEKAEKKEIPNGDQVTWNWDNEKAGLKEIEVESTTASYMLKDIEKRDAAGEFGIQDKPYITLLQKLK
jgi:hypothetical protein